MRLLPWSEKNGLKLHREEEGVGLSTGRRYSLKRSLRPRLASPLYCPGRGGGTQPPSCGFSL